jgi:quercetin dioxygenase-like cupin family protein
MPEEREEGGGEAPSGGSHSPKHGGRAIEAPVLRFDLGAELQVLRTQPTYQTGKPSGRTLVKQPGLRIVIMALKPGGRLQEHHASGPISIQVIDGPVRVHLPDTTVELSAGELIALESGIRHDVEALDAAVFLLTIGRTTYEHVSDLHEPGN